MVVKTITIKEDAYKVLAGMKRDAESFSDVIIRIGAERPFTAKDLFGISKRPKEDVEKLRKHAIEMRESMNKDFERRRNVLDRHFSTN